MQRNELLSMIQSTKFTILSGQMIVLGDLSLYLKCLQVNNNMQNDCDVNGL